MRHRNECGFTLTELLLVLAVIGLITAVAIPSLIGQRQRAKRIGDAEANARVLGMALEATKAENGIYGPVNATATWEPGNNTPTLVGFSANPAPNFSPRGNTQMSFIVTTPTPLTYQIMVRLQSSGGEPVVGFDQTGAKTLYMK